MNKILISIILLLSLQSVIAQDERMLRLDSIFSAYSEKNLFTGSLLYYENGKTLFSKAYGFADWENKRPNTPNTPFCLASVSKQFTAMCVAILSEQKKLSFDDKLNKFIPDYPHGEKISIHHLLTHTSGIHNFTDMPFYTENWWIKHHELTDIISMFKNEPLDFEPGEKFSYSNSGYVLLSYLIEKVSGMSYAEFTQKYIFKKLGMKNSGYYAHAKDIPSNAALGYSLNEADEYELASFVDRSVPNGAGGIYSSVEDMKLWHEALNSEILVSKATMQQIFTPYKDDYAYGWAVVNRDGKLMQMHNGGIQGFATLIVRFPENNSCLVILRNCDNQNLFNPFRTAQNVIENKPVQLPLVRKAIPIDTANAERYTGHFYSENFELDIVLKNGEMWIAVKNQGEANIYAEKENFFFLKVVDAQMEFKEFTENKYQTLIFRQNGIETEMKRVN